MEIRSDIFQIRDDLIGSTLVDLCEIRFAGSSGCKLRDDQQRLTRAWVLFVPLLGLASESTSLSAGIHMRVQAVWYDVFSAPVFLPYFSMLTLSCPLLMLGSKSTCLT